MVLVQNHFCISICISVNRTPITNPLYYHSKRYHLFTPNTKVKLFLTHDLLYRQDVGKNERIKVASVTSLPRVIAKFPLLLYPSLSISNILLNV